LPSPFTTAFLIFMVLFLAAVGSGQWFPLPSAANTQGLLLIAIYGFVALFILYWMFVAALTYQLARRRKVSRAMTLFCLLFALTFTIVFYPWRFADGSSYFNALMWPHVAYLLYLSFLALRPRTDA
jgi:hypothetical protein